MIEIRANKVFSAVKQRGPSRVAHVRIPLRFDPEQEDHSPTLFETYLLIALMKLTDATGVFEFGTFMGVTTLNLALNARAGAEIYTLDVDDASAREVQSELPKDGQLIGLRMKHYQMAWSEDFDLARRAPIEALYGDSTRFDFSPYSGRMDLVFLDGGRDLRTVRSDYGNAAGMLRPYKPAAIAWHDYQNPETPELTDFLDQLAGKVDLLHVHGSSLVLYLNFPL